MSDYKKETIFANGFIFKRPNEKAPDWIKGNISIKVEEFISFLEKYQYSGWVNLDLCLSKDGQKLYCQLNQWKKDDKQQQTPQEQFSQSVDERINKLKEEQEPINIQNIPF